jgi:ornithine cyclodeaminase/alanine dehydrogenase-like protein (mu-crystallin family)
VAAKYLARGDARTATICGCGKQGRVQLAALTHVLPIERVHAWDASADAMERFATREAAERGLDVRVAHDLEAAVRESDVVVTCTPSRAPFIRRGWIRAGAFVAAVGADSPGKQELDADVLAPPAVLVVDLLAQAVAVGDLQHALRAGLVAAEGVHAELGDIVSGRKAGRTGDEQVIVYDATGTALQDVVAAAEVYRRAVAAGVGTTVELAQ